MTAPVDPTPQTHEHVEQPSLFDLAPTPTESQTDLVPTGSTEVVVPETTDIVVAPSAEVVPVSDQSTPVEATKPDGKMSRRGFLIGGGLALAGAAVGGTLAAKALSGSKGGNSSSTPTTEKAPVFNPEIDNTVGDIHTARIIPGEKVYTDVRANGETIQIPHLRSDKKPDEYMESLLANLAWALTQGTTESMQAFSGLNDVNKQDILDLHEQFVKYRAQDLNKKDLQASIYDVTNKPARFIKRGDPADLTSGAPTLEDGNESIYWDSASGTVYVQYYAHPRTMNTPWQGPDTHTLTDDYTWAFDKIIAELDPKTKQLVALSWHSNSTSSR